MHVKVSNRAVQKIWGKDSHFGTDGLIGFGGYPYSKYIRKGYSFHPLVVKTLSDKILSFAAFLIFLCGETVNEITSAVQYPGTQTI